MKHLYKLILLVLGTLLTCCSGGELRTDKPTFFELYSQEPELQAQLEKWAPRWSAATGITISVSTQGTPVSFQENIEAPTDPESSVPVEEQSHIACGITVMTYDRNNPDGWYSVNRILIDRTSPAGCPGWGYSVAHELGHVLAGPLSPHSPSGLYSKYLHTNMVYTIDESSVTTVCTFAHCSAFAPE